MATIIKAHRPDGGARGVAFRFDDLAAEAEARLGRARAEAERLLADARRDADEIRDEARREGLRQASDELERRVDQRLSGVLPALRQATSELHDARQAWLTHWETAAVRLAVAMAERVIRRELPRRPDVPVALVREALELASGSPLVRVHLNPTDHDALGRQVEAVVCELSALAATSVIPDSEVTPGGCLVETRFGLIDQRFETQLRRIEEELA
jgi:flagellar biosynthesis/type III secretory pathway protein FliH